MNKRNLEKVRVNTALNIIQLYENFKNTVGNPSAVLNSDASRPVYKPHNPLMFEAIEFIADIDKIVKEIPSPHNVTINNLLNGNTSTDSESAFVGEVFFSLEKFGKLVIARKLHTYFR
jgi:hypothetical protein